MYKRMLVGLCAALAFAAGSPAVHALKIVENAGDDPATATTARASNTYAKETLLSTEITAASDEADTTKYYNIAETELFLSAPADITANAGDTYIVSYTLDGMVFQTAVVNGDLTGAGGSGGFTIAAGGAAGDKSVVFRLASDATVATTTTNLALEALYAISAAGSGSVTRIVTNQSLAVLNIPGVSGTMTHTGSGVIKLGSGLKETAMAMDAEATVEHSFRSFNGAALATVGSLEVTYNADVRQSQDVDGTAVSNLNQIIDIGDTNGAANSTVEIMGDFSFATMAFLHGDSDCSPAGTDNTALTGETDILTREGTGDDEMVTGAAAQNVTAFATATLQYLCIMVDTSEDGMRIPETVAYTAMGDYAKIDNGAFDPAPMKQTLGAIERDGTTVRFPYLTTREGYVQRIRIVNRGGEANYTLHYATNAEAVEGTDAGVLEPGERKVLMVVDVVEIDGSTTTAGTLIVEAEPNLIDVATTVNTADGGIDTVVYTEE